jgi:hypothetical protein
MVHHVAAALQEIPDVGGHVGLVFDDEDAQALVVGRVGLGATACRVDV